jgi:alpha-N-arabinofuranosidase
MRRWAAVVVLALLACALLWSRAVGTRATSTGAWRELVDNGGFEDSGDPARSWAPSEKSAGKGVIERDGTRFHGGAFSLKLRPNARNDREQPLAAVQVIPAGSLKAQTLALSGHLAAEGGAVAVLGVLAVRGGKVEMLALQTETGKAFTRREKQFTVPDDPDVTLVLLASAMGNSGAAWFDDVSIAAPGPVPSTRPVPAPVHRALAPLEAAIAVDASQVLRTIPRTLYGTNVEWVWNGYGLWQERENRLDPELVRLARELGVSVVRYPGGYFSDFYHWREGVGDQSKRQEMLHVPGDPSRSRPAFGTDEALEFAHEIGAELLITVNAGTGSAQEAADWVRYVNREGRRVRYWEVGNEIYIKNDSAISKAITIDPSTYASRFLEFARAMRAADPGIMIGAIGGSNQGRYSLVSYPDWDRTVLQRAGSEIDFLAVHNAYAPVMVDGPGDLRTVYRALLAAPRLVARNLATLAGEISDFAPARASKIGLAVTEWGPLFQFDPKGPYIDHNKTLGSAVYAASVLKAIIESQRTSLANMHTLHDYSMMGWIGPRNQAFPPDPHWAPTARYYAMQLFTEHFGDQLVGSTTDAPTFDSSAVGLVDAVRDVPYVETVASLGSQGRTLHLIVINKHFDQPVDARIELHSFFPAPQATAWTLTGSGIDAHTGTVHIQIPGVIWGKQAEDDVNPRFSYGGPGEVTLTESRITDAGERFSHRFPPLSVTCVVLTRR